MVQLSAGTLVFYKVYVKLAPVAIINQWSWFYCYLQGSIFFSMPWNFVSNKIQNAALLVQFFTVILPCTDLSHVILQVLKPRTPPYTKFPHVIY